MGFGLAGSAAPPLTCPPVGIPLCPLNRFFAIFTTKLPSQRNGRSLLLLPLLLVVLPPHRLGVVAESYAQARLRGGALAGVHARRQPSDSHAQGESLTPDRP
ncbi:hypothetical protein E2C01_020145 [Portunus trituberculatus]|uniref:Uncharacterized protein n=1 Tax=Portunus trituberculatus TaxID=210409 RepID=A0A5B7E1A5_PORTR|nr:hypothetical protein [Portunus trituberculatus]